MDPTSVAATTTNAMNIFQQFSQLMFLQSLAATGGKFPPMFDYTKLQQQPSIQTFSPILPEGNYAANNFQTISDLLSSSQNLKSQYSTPTFPSETSSSFKMDNNFGFNLPYSNPPSTSRQYKVPVNRESSQPLQEWMDQHITNPYPTHQEVKQLSNQTGFTFKQVRNWFTNNRRRYEEKCGTNPLPWTKKEVPKACRKTVSSESSSSEGC